MTSQQNQCQLDRFHVYFADETEEVWRLQIFHTLFILIFDFGFSASDFTSKL